MPLNKIAAAIAEALPGDLSGDVRRNINAAVQSVLEKMDLVTREELEVQEKFFFVPARNSKRWKPASPNWSRTQTRLAIDTRAHDRLSERTVFFAWEKRAGLRSPPPVKTFLVLWPVGVSFFNKGVDTLLRVIKHHITRHYVPGNGIGLR